MKRLSGQSTQNSLPLLLHVDATWQSIDQFTTNLNNYYLETHDDTELNFPELPSSTSTLLVSEFHTYHLLNQILEKLRTLKTFQAGSPEITPHLLAQPISDIINSMLRSGYFQAMWKKAQITPVNKVRSPKLYKDMRPIALTFHLAKISENIIAHHIKQELPDRKSVV